MSDKTQNEIDDEEWINPNNWSGFWCWKCYFSKRDSRIWVPLLWNAPLSPSTINLGHRWGFFVMGLIFYVFVAITAAVGWLACHAN